MAPPHRVGFEQNCVDAIGGHQLQNNLGDRSPGASAEPDGSHQDVVPCHCGNATRKEQEPLTPEPGGPKTIAKVDPIGQQPMSAFFPPRNHNSRTLHAPTNLAANVTVLSFCPGCAPGGPQLTCPPKPPKAIWIVVPLCKRKPKGVGHRKGHSWLWKHNAQGAVVGGTLDSPKPADLQQTIEL